MTELPLRQWLQEPAVRRDLGDSCGFALMDATTGEMLAALDADRPMTIASCQKLFTAAAVLTLFDPSHTFTTAVLAERDRLYLRGGGDPRIPPSALSALAAHVAAGRIDGGGAGPLQVFVDETLFAPFAPAHGWRASYLPIEVQPVVPLVLPEYFGDAPGRAVGETFAGLLSARGVPAAYAGRGAAPNHLRVLGAVDSEPISALVSHMLQTSHNLTAEVLHRHVALAMGEPPDWQGSKRASLRVLASLGVDVSGAVVADGSGLSSESRWPLRPLVGLLRRLAIGGSTSPLAAIYPGGAMAQLGLTGSLSAINSWFPQEAVRGRIWAKSGTLTDTYALAGIALPATGGSRVFAIVAAGDSLAPDAARRRLCEFAQVAAGRPIASV